MLIVLEGPDGVGKSTLARQLHDVIQLVDPRSTVVSMHKGPPTSHPLDEYLLPLLNYRPGTNVHYVLDRWHWGEFVYPQLLGRKTQLDAASWWYLNQYVRRLGGVVVLCHASTESVIAEHTARGETMHAADHEVATKLFVEASHQAAVAQLTHRWETDDRYTNVREIVRVAQLWESYVTPLAHYVTYVGAVRPRYLLLGDVRHGVDRIEQIISRTDRRPAFMPYNATSGQWLLNALTRSTDLRASTAIANARDVDDVFQLWRDLGKPKIATLGKQAHSELQPYNLPHGRAPHPQFGRRFYHHHQDSYVAALFGALENQEDNWTWRGSSPGQPEPRSTPRSSTRFADSATDESLATVPLTT